MSHLASCGVGMKPTHRREQSRRMERTCILTIFETWIQLSLNIKWFTSGFFVPFFAPIDSSMSFYDFQLVWAVFFLFRSMFSTFGLFRDMNQILFFSLGHSELLSLSLATEWAWMVEEAGGRVLTQVASQLPSASMFRDLTTQPGPVPNSWTYRRQTSLILICQLIKERWFGKAEGTWAWESWILVLIWPQFPHLPRKADYSVGAALTFGTGGVWQVERAPSLASLPEAGLRLSPGLDPRFVFFRALRTARSSFTHSSVWAFILWEVIFPTGSSTWVGAVSF